VLVPFPSRIGGSIRFGAEVSYGSFPLKDECDWVESRCRVNCLGDVE